MKLELVVVGSLALIGSAWGSRVVNLDFNNNDVAAYSGIAAAPDAGTVWNSGLKGTVQLANLADSSGGAGMVDVAWTTSATYQHLDGAGVGGDKTAGSASLTNAFNLMYDYIYKGGSASFDITLSDLSDGAAYDLYVYSYGDSAGQNGIITVGGQTATSGVPSPRGVTDLTEGIHYVIFTNLVASNGQLVITVDNDGAAFCACNGLQLLTADSVICPAVVDASNDLDSEVEVTWSPVPGADSYTIYRSTTSGSNYTVRASGLVATNYIDTDVENSTTYYYVVTTIDGTTESAPSAEAMGLPLDTSDTTPPAAPAGFSATTYKHYGMVLSWTANTEVDLAAAPYSIYRSETSGSDYELIVTNLSSTVYTNLFIAEDTTYYYVVKAVDLLGNLSEPSTEASDYVPFNPNNGDIEWGSNADQGYEDLDNNGPNGFAQNSQWVFQIADINDTNLLYDVVLQISGDPFQPRETWGGIGVSTHIFTNETLTISMAGVYERATTGLANTGVKVADRAISSNAVPVINATLQLMAYAPQGVDPLQLLTPPSSNGTVFAWSGTIAQTNNATFTTLGESFFRVDGGTVASGYDLWVQDLGVDIGAETDDYDGDGFSNFYEYALNGDPTNAAVWGEAPVLLNQGGSLLYTHLKRKNDNSLTYTIESAGNLVVPSWGNAGATVIGENPGSGDYSVVTNAIPSDTNASFIRLKMNY